ncbi:MAG: STN domain-containing protein, partial [Pseudobacter sp.]|uniref:STN domain-containing protein n=1 Tax=Pseudobacter sp. TaxID=2045420 RepID=UPI003F81185D
MKLTSVLLIAFVFHAGAKGFAQNITYSSRNVPIEQVFTEIKKQTGYFFLYTESILENARPVTISVRDMPLPEFLEKIFKNQPLKYTVASKTITVTNAITVKPFEELLREAEKQAAITVKVTDSVGAPLPGAS